MLLRLFNPEGAVESVRCHPVKKKSMVSSGFICENQLEKLK
jgi:hypothetical protein